MDRSAGESRRARFWISAWVTTALALGACTLFPWLLMALERDDVEASESTLVLAVARQVVHGPRELYGPYGGGNPLVLIHAPLYYRLAALCAWPMARAGLRPESAALIAGRSISLAGWAATLAGAFLLARFQGAPRFSGWWAVLLAAATPVYGGVLVEVRPDMLGVGLQTWGVVLLLGALQAERPGEGAIVFAFVCFGLAGCVKQHLVVAPAVSTFLLVAARAGGRVRSRTIVGALLFDLVILCSYYGLEEWVTEGRMSRSVFVAARECAVIHPSSWHNARDTMLVLCWKCVGLILLFAAVALAGVSAGAGQIRRLLAAAGTVLIGLVAALAVVQIFAVDLWISRSIVVGLVVTMVCFMPICAVALGRAWRAGGIDIAYVLYLAGELVLTAYLFRLSTGAWYNYAVGGVVFASILAARALARAVQRPLPTRAVLGVSLAVLAVPAFALTDLKETVSRRAESVLIPKLFERVAGNSGAIFFVDRPGFNRVHGRPALVYDPWLYPVFEAMNLAEPRSVWLARALETGPVRIVLASSPQSEIDGLTQTLPELGYSFRGQVGPWFVWTRQIRQADAASDRVSAHVRLDTTAGPERSPGEFHANPFSGSVYLLHSWDTTKEFAGCRLRADSRRAEKRARSSAGEQRASYFGRRTPGTVEAFRRLDSQKVAGL